MTYQHVVQSSEGMIVLSKSALVQHSMPFLRKLALRKTSMNIKLKIAATS